MWQCGNCESYNSGIKFICDVCEFPRGKYSKLTRMFFYITGLLFVLMVIWSFVDFLTPLRIHKTHVGLGGIRPDCLPVYKIDPIPSFMFIDNSWIYFSVEYQLFLGREIVEVTVKDTNQDIIYEDEVELNSRKSCVWRAFRFSADTPSGIYTFILNDDQGEIISEEVSVNYDLGESYYIRTIGEVRNMSIGVGGVNNQCQVLNPQRKIRIKSLQDAKGIYFATPYTMQDVDGNVDVKIYDVMGEIIYEFEYRLKLQNPLCYYHFVDYTYFDAAGWYKFVIIYDGVEYTSRIEVLD